MTLRPEHIEEALNKKTFDEIDPDEVLKHYGYKPEEVRCNGVGIGVWRKEEAFQKLGDIGAFMRFVDHAGKMGRGRFESVRPCWGVRFYYSFSLPSRNSMTRCAAYLAFAVSWRCQAP